MLDPGLHGFCARGLGQEDSKASAALLVCGCVCVRVCVRACVRARVCARARVGSVKKIAKPVLPYRCVRVSERVCVRVCVRACDKI